MKAIKSIPTLILALAIFFSVQAQEQKEATNADEVAAKLNNPTAAIGSLSFLFDYKTHQGDLPGADDQTAWSMTFQPSLPKPLGKSGYNLLFRPALGLIFKQPVFDGTGFESSGFQFGNIGFDLAVGTTTKQGFLLMGGLAGTLPTASSEDIRALWAFGPEVLFGYVNPKVIIGVLTSQQWDVESGPVETSVLGGQYFIYFPIGKGRTIGAAPLYSYNWKTEELTFPLGIGYSSVTQMGANPFKYALYTYYHVANPDPIGPLWQIRLQLTPVVKLPWK